VPVTAEPEALLSTGLDEDVANGSLTLTSPALTGPVETSLPTFGGKGPANARVYVVDLDSGYLYCYGTVNVSGNWSCKPAMQMSNGVRAMLVYSGSVEISITIRISDPNSALSVETPYDNQEVTTRTPVFSGSAVGSRVVVGDMSSGQTLCQANVAANGAWTCTTDTSQAYQDGAHQVVLSVYNNGWVAQDTQGFIVNASGGKRTLTHTFDVVMVSPIGQPNSWYSQTQVKALLSEVQAAYNRDTPANWSLKLGTFTAINSAAACNNSGTQWTAAAAAAAQAAGRADTSTTYYSNTPGAHLLVLEYNQRDCWSSTTGFAMTPRYPSVTAGGMLVLRVSTAYSVASTLGHEFGHNLGWKHSQYQACTRVNKSVITWDMSNSQSCKTIAYADTWDMMGGSSLVSARISPVRSFDVGLWGIGREVQMIDTGVATKRYTLSLVGSSSANLKALLVGDIYSSSKDPLAGWPYVFSFRADPSGKALGVSVLRTNFVEQVLLLPANDSTPSWGEAQYLVPNDKYGDFRSVNGALRVHVVSMNASEAVIEVTRTCPQASSATPTISGSASVGSTLTASVARQTPDDAKVTWQWFRDGKQIDGATNVRYLVVAADVGKKLSVKATVTAPGYTDGAATSAAVSASEKSSIQGVTLYRFYNTLTMSHFYTADESEKNHVLATWPQFKLEAAVGTVIPGTATNDPNQTVVYRFYRAASGTHFYTADVAERDHVIATWPNIFTYEGPKYVAYSKQVAGTIPVYRFYNVVTGVHFYTADLAERDHVIATWPNIFTYEGIRYYIMPPR
jgi:hypothetical protein